MPATSASRIRGADVIARTLHAAGCRTVFTLSGNHIMSVFDAVLDVDLHLIHTRHEAACVHMADAFARLTGEVGVALVTGGQGHTNAVAALPTAHAADAPLVLLSGHAGVSELGRGGFQELDQAAVAAPLTKASWMVTEPHRLGHDLAEAIAIAKSGRPGSVHLSLPHDLLDAYVGNAETAVPPAGAFARRRQSLPSLVAQQIVGLLGEARHPLILAGPMLATPAGRSLCESAAARLGIPVLPMESPRGIADPSLGAFAEVLAAADLIVLLGKPHDFTLKFANPPHVRADARFIVIDPEQRVIDRAKREKAKRVVLSALADADAALTALGQAAVGQAGSRQWLGEVRDAVAFRPSAWRGPFAANRHLHPAQMCAPIEAVLERDPTAVFIADGGEIGQWAQACIPARRRLINGVAGSIGSAVPFALAARMVERDAPVIAVMGDGAFGFHMAEIDTALRHDLPVVLVIGNDARWNAEHQIQLRNFGAERTHSCSLLPTRYDLVATALGGHGDFVTSAQEMGPALERAVAARKPAVVNVMIEGLPAPLIRRTASPA